MSERRHKYNRKSRILADLIYLQSDGEYGEPPRKQPLPPRTVGKGERIREVPADYPNRAQRRAAMGRNPVEVALQRLKFEGRRSDEGVAALNAERKQAADERRKHEADERASWHRMQSRNERFRIDFAL